jgi:Flp pilus assembly protein CpaB
VAGAAGLRARVWAPLIAWLTRTTGDRPPPGAWLALGAFLLLGLLLQAFGAGLLWARPVLVPRKPLMTGVVLRAEDVEVQWWTAPAETMRTFAPADQLEHLVGQQLQRDVFPPLPLSLGAFQREDLALAARHAAVGVPLPEAWSAELVRPGGYLTVWAVERDRRGEVQLLRVVPAARVVSATYREAAAPHDEPGVHFERSGVTVGVALEVEPETARTLVAAEHGELGIEVGVVAAPEDEPAAAAR